MATSMGLNTSLLPYGMSTHTSTTQCEYHNLYSIIISTLDLKKCPRTHTITDPRPQGTNTTNYTRTRVRGLPLSRLLSMAHVIDSVDASRSLPLVSLMTIAFSKPFPLTNVTISLSSFSNSLLNISPIFWAFSVIFSSSKTCPRKLKKKYIYI